MTEEAWSIAQLSAKASATLSRPCLRGMIRDFQGIKKAGFKELENKVNPVWWQAFDAVRKLGNVVARKIAM